MSVTTPTDTPTTAPNQETPKVMPKEKSVKKAGHFTKEASLSQVVTAVATARKIDTSRAGKLVRSHIRANFDNYAKGKGVPKWGTLTKAKSNKDGNRYPTMPASVANAIITRMSSTNNSK